MGDLSTSRSGILLVLGTGTSLVGSLWGLLMALASFRLGLSLGHGPLLEPLLEAALQIPEEGAVGGQHDQDEHDGIDEHAVVIEVTEELGQHIEKGRGDDGAPDIAQAAQHHKDQDEDGGVEVELLGSQGGVVHGIEGAGSASQHGRGDKGGEFELGGADAHALGGNAVVPQGHDGPAGAAVHQVEDHGEGHQYQDKAGGEGRELQIGGDAHGPLENGDTAFGKIKRHLVLCGEVEAIFIHTDVENVDDVFDDLPKGQSDDGKVVAAETEHRHTYDGAGNTGQDGANDHGHQQPEGAGGDGGLEREIGHHTGKGPHAHKAGVAQAQLTGNAHHQVEGDGHGDIGTDRHQLSLKGGGEDTAGVEDLEHHKSDDDHGICNGIVQ